MYELGFKDEAWKGEWWMMGDEDGESKQETVRVGKIAGQANRMYLRNCYIRGGRKSSVLSWKDVPSIWVGLLQHPASTDIQTGLEGVGNHSVPVHTVALFRGANYVMERCSSSRVAVKEGTLSSPSQSSQVSTKHSRRDNHLLQNSKPLCWKTAGRQGSFHSLDPVLFFDT